MSGPLSDKPVPFWPTPQGEMALELAALRGRLDAVLRVVGIFYDCGYGDALSQSRPLASVPDLVPR